MITITAVQSLKVRLDNLDKACLLVSCDPDLFDYQLGN